MVWNRFEVGTEWTSRTWTVVHWCGVWRGMGWRSRLTISLLNKYPFKQAAVASLTQILDVADNKYE